MATITSLVTAFAVLAVCTANEYQGWTAAKKSDYLWEKINADHTPGTWPSALGLAKLFFEGMDASFDTVSDFMPEGRSKLIHSVSVIMKASWHPDPTCTYTGLFQGAEYGFVRISFAAQPTATQINPGVSVKFLRTAQPSGNIFALYNLGGQEEGDFNYFSHNFSNHPMFPEHPNIAEKALKAKFATASDFPQMLGLSSFARYDEAGNDAGTPGFPFETLFNASPELRSGLATEKVNGDFQGAMLRHVHDNMLLFDVDCRATPSAEPVRCGQIFSRSNPTPSAFSDAGLFFQHTRMEEDYKYHPEWKAELEAMLVKTEVDGKISYSLRR